MRGVRDGMRLPMKPLAGPPLPEPVASGMFTNIATNNAADGVYTFMGDAVALGDVIDLESLWASFDPDTDIDAGGFRCGFIEGLGPQPIVMPLTAALMASMVDGFTIVIEVFTANPMDMRVTTQTLDNQENGEAKFILDSGTNLSAATIQYHGDGATTDNTAFDEIPEGQVAKVAATFTGNSISFSIAGNAVEATSGFPAVHAATELIRMDFSTYDEMAYATLRLRSFDIYAAVDDADLPSLSAL